MKPAGPARGKTHILRIGFVPDYLKVKIVAKNRDSFVECKDFAQSGFGQGSG